MNKKHERYTRLILFFSILALTACGGSSGDSNTSPDPTTPPTFILTPYNTIGLVTDLDGNGISFARVKGESVSAPLLESSSQGVFYGDMGVAADGWLQITANGYAQNFFQSSGKLNDIQIFAAQLTPVGAWYQFEAGNTKTISHSNISAELPADLFTTDEVIVEVTDALPQHVGASYALTSENEFIQFLRMFSITARNLDATPVAFSAGAMMPVTITLPASVANTPPLFYFDVSSGFWQIIANACSLNDDTHMVCNLPHLSVFAVGGESQAAELPYSDPASSAESAANINHARALLAEAQANGSDTSEANNLLLIAVELDSIQASEYALANQNEKGKMRLMAAAAIRASVNLSYDSLLSDVLNIAENIAQNFLDDDSCGKVEEMKAAMAQLETLDSDSGRFDKLEQKIATVIASCDPWIGKVTVSFYRLPVTFDGFIELGGMSWSEQHDITLLIDPDSASGNPPQFMLSGKDEVLLKMLQVQYVKQEAGSCGMNRTEIKLFADPQVAMGRLNISGWFDSNGKKFSFNPFTTPLANLMFSIWSYSYDADCHLIVTPSPDIPYATGYGSIISMHGIDFTSAITLQEMLNNGHKYSTDKRDTVEGIRIVPISIPASIPWSALSFMQVQWHFTHDKKSSD